MSRFSTARLLRSSISNHPSEYKQSGDDLWITDRAFLIRYQKNCKVYTSEPLLAYVKWKYLQTNSKCIGALVATRMLPEDVSNVWSSAHCQECHRRWINELHDIYNHIDNASEEQQLCWLGHVVRIAKNSTALKAQDFHFVRKVRWERISLNKIDWCTIVYSVTIVWVSQLRGRTPRKVVTINSGESK